MRPYQCIVRDISEGGLDPGAALEFVSDPGFGGIALFVGRVRNVNHGRVVTGISYDMFVPLAMHGFAEIAERVGRDFGQQVKLYIGHAKGRLGLGDLAMVVAAGTPHRDEAFRACRQVVEAVKHTSPIWKQEHYEDGDSAWSEGCSLCGHASGEDGHAGHGH
jgi:molybdopterin synthase catalytic subunit